MSTHQQRVSRKSVTRGCFSGLDQEWRIEWWRKRVPNSIKYLGTQLFWNWKSQPQLCPMHLRSNSPETAVSAFSRAMPPEGPWGCNENLVNAILWATKGPSTCWNIRIAQQSQLSTFVQQQVLEQPFSKAFMFSPNHSPESGGLLWFCACMSSELDEHTPFMPARLQHYV